MAPKRIALLQHTLLLASLFVGCGKPIVTGNVSDVFGTPLASAAVTVEGTSFSTTTNNDGHYSIQFVPGQFNLRIKKDGYTSSTVPFSVAEPTTVPAATVILYPRPTEPGIYYIGKEKLEKLSTLRLRREQVRNRSAWLPGSTRYLLQTEEPLKLPEGEARFIDTAPRSIQLARATGRSGLILDTAHRDAAGVVNARAEKVGDEELTVWSVQLQPGVYGWIELEENILGDRVPGETYYGFGVGDAPWFTFLGTYESSWTFDPNATQQEMAYGLELWRDPTVGIVGHLNYPVMEADTPAGRIDNVRYDATTGSISFRARVRALGERPNEVHEFTGKLNPDSIDGTFKRYVEDGALIQTQQVVLKKQRLFENNFEDLVSWQERYSEPILQFRGPR